MENGFLLFLKLFLAFLCSSLAFMQSSCCGFFTFNHHGCSASAPDVVKLEEAQFGVDLGVQTSSTLYHHQVVVEVDYECHSLSLKLDVVVH